MRYLGFIILISIQFLSLLAFPQNKQLKFERIGIKQGLSDPNISCIMQDSRGFIWVGTRYGLNRYDGQQFRVFFSNPNDSTSLGSSYIQDIIEDSKGNIWIATSGGGINKYDRMKNRFKQYLHQPTNPKSISGNDINKILEDKSGKFWIASNEGINLFDPETEYFQHFFNDVNDSTTISDNYVTDVFADSQGTLWFGTQNGGLNRMVARDSTFIHFKENGANSKAISGNNISDIFEDSSHRLWVGTVDDGLNLFDREKEEFQHFKKSPKGNSIALNSIKTIAEDDQHVLWIGTENGGISLFDYTMQKFSNFAYDEIDDNSLASNSVRSILKDREGNMWVGLFSGGVNLYKKSTGNFKHYKRNSKPGSLSNNFVLSIYKDDDQNLWVGTDGGGLNRFDPRTGESAVYKFDPLRNSISGNSILSIAQDKAGDLWIGTWANGLNKFNRRTQKFSNYKHSNTNQASLSNNNIYGLTIAKNGEIWIGTFGGGLTILNEQTKEFRHFKYNKDDSTSLSNDKVYTILEDQTGRFWIGTADGGINLYMPRTNSFIRYCEENKRLVNNTVPQFLESRSGVIYACTLGGGLNFFDPSRQKFIQVQGWQDFASTNICAALEDDHGNIWVSTNKGISKFDPKHNTVKNYSMEDGLQGDEFKLHSAFKDQSGMLYFGGIKGYNSFLPDQIADNTNLEAKIILTDFQIFNKRVPIAQNGDDPSPLKQDISETDSIRLTYDQNMISFEFVSLDYSSSGTKVYGYMLEGLDRDWNIVRNKNTATYTNLDAGNYIFKVKSQNNLGEWSSEISSVNVTIVPPFWLTWWFKILMGTILVIAPIGFTYYRIRRLRLESEKLEQLVDERTIEIQSKNELLKDSNSTKDKLFSIISHDLRSPFNAILGFQDLLINNYYDYSDIERLEMFGQVHSTTNQVYYLVENLLNWSRVQTNSIKQHPERFILKEIIDQKIDLYQDIAKAKGIGLQVQISGKLMAYADINIMKITLRNLINNSIKFTPTGGSITIKATQENHDLIISVTDSGIGLTQKEMDSLFDIENATTKMGTNGERGSGLGLILCKELVDKNKGTMTVSSEPGKGSTFSFTIPYAPRE